MTVRLTPGNGEKTRIFHVLSAKLDTAKGHLTIAGRDGFVCLGLQGQWEIEVTPSNLVAMSIDEIERLHDGRSLVLMN